MFAYHPNLGNTHGIRHQHDNFSLLHVGICMYARACLETALQHAVLQALTRAMGSYCASLAPEGCVSSPVATLCNGPCHRKQPRSEEAQGTGHRLSISWMDLIPCLEMRIPRSPSLQARKKLHPGHPPQHPEFCSPTQTVSNGAM